MARSSELNSSLSGARFDGLRADGVVGQGGIAEVTYYAIGVEAIFNPAKQFVGVAFGLGAPLAAFGKLANTTMNSC